jgi:hypothetical protein
MLFRSLTEGKAVSFRDLNLKQIYDAIVDGARLQYLFERRRLPPAMQDFCRKKVDLALLNMSILIVAGGSLFHLSTLVIEPMIEELAPHLGILRIFHLICLGLLAVVVASSRFLGLARIRLALLPYVLLCNVGNVLVAKTLMQSSEHAYEPMLMFIYQIATGIVLIVVLPFSGALPNLAYCLYHLAANAWILAGQGFLGLGLLLVAVILAIAFTLKLVIWGVIVNVFKNDDLALQRVAAAERALMARDLELARQIQDSIAPPPLVLWRGAVVRYRYHKHSAVGGDWAAIHVDADGGVVCLVADAMGKGLQASLVIHAVQSLWAESLNDGRALDPDEWLRNVNRSLFNMGKGATHMVTLGVLKLTPGKGTYWSAGHVPLFCVGDGEEPEVRPILSIGSPLGIIAKNHVRSHAFDTSRCRYLLLGTDGVFEKGTRHNRAEIVGILRRIETEQASLADVSRANDDKTLITIDFAAAEDRRRDVEQSGGRLRKLA